MAKHEIEEQKKQKKLFKLINKFKPKMSVFEPF